MTLSLKEIQDLRASLPDLAFDPSRDEGMSQVTIAAHYLNFYNIDFGDLYFHRWGRIILQRYTIACHYWFPSRDPVVPPKGMVMVLHGYFDHVGLFGHLFRYLLERGYGVVGLDLPGHGLSSGERASIATFEHYTEVFEAILGRVSAAFSCPVSAIGQSTGGAILLKYLGNHCDSDLARLALLAPLVEPRLWSLNKLVYALTHRFRKGVKRFFIDNAGDESFQMFLKEDPLQAQYIPIEWIAAMKVWVRECRSMAPCPYPVTIIQGDDDNTVAWKFNTRLIAKKFPNSRLVMIEGGHHHLVNEKQPLRDRIFDRMGF